MGVTGLVVPVGFEPAPAFALQGDVHAWVVPLPEAASFSDAWRGLLSTDERARADRFAFAADKHRYTASHVALRLLLAGYLDVPPGAIRFGETESKKPFVAAPASPLRFNLSHSGALALVAVSAGEVGADVEAVRGDRHTHEVADRYYTAAERGAMNRADDPHDFFFRLWAAKEAVLKAAGTGLFGPFTEIDFAPTGNQEAPLRSFQPAPGYEGAVYPVSPEQRLLFFRLENFERFERRLPPSARRPR